jgi:hypothetical protein
MKVSIAVSPSLREDFLESPVFSMTNLPILYFFCEHVDEGHYSFV